MLEFQSTEELAICVFVLEDSSPATYFFTFCQGQKVGKHVCACAVKTARDQFLTS
jgi:hypothetical protein